MWWAPQVSPGSGIETVARGGGEGGGQETKQWETAPSWVAGRPWAGRETGAHEQVDGQGSIRCDKK